jgi:hypothetical protein
MPEGETKVVCAGCGEPMEINEPAYAVQSGYIGDDGKFVPIHDAIQYFHIGKCLNSDN